MSRLEKLKKAESLSDLAVLLGYLPKSVSYILYKIPADQKYSQFNIPKSNGESRAINAPTEKLKKLQQRLAQLLTDCYNEIDILKDKPKSLSHGFRKKHSIITNASNHKNRRYVFNIDLENFFPSINFGRVQGYFVKDKHFQLNIKVATVIAQIVCHDGILPQGSPCSPIISNLIGNILDNRMVYIAIKAKCTYTRYADDLTFSTNRKDFPEIIAHQTSNNEWKASEYLKGKIEKTGFVINESKSSMQYKTSRQITTGLIVNKKVNIKSEYYKKSRSCCYSLFNNDWFYFIKQEYSQLKTSGNVLEESLKQSPFRGSINQLEGFLSFIYHVKRPHDKNSIGQRKNNPNAITKLYRHFLFYKHFFTLDKPLLICEGKTDYVYIKCALKKLHENYPILMEIIDDKYIFNIKFLNLTNHFRDVFAISKGTPGLNFLFEKYEKYMVTFKGNGKRFPVIMIFDTDNGSKEVLKHCNKRDHKAPFIKLTENLYVVFISDLPDKEIEDLFDEDVRMTILGDKSFNPKNPHGNLTEYGKNIFAEKVIKPNMNEINFDQFKYVFDNIKLVLEDYSKTYNSLVG